ncbi:hypothetical protein, partial [Nocardia tengchongensis]|uniref:hypothetical protein n=1 Tax=Nocardia tengchongensis TaxID=2055889 RepID=UPI0036746093
PATVDINRVTIGFMVFRLLGHNLRIGYGFGGIAQNGGSLDVEGEASGVPHPPEASPFGFPKSGLGKTRSLGDNPSP